MSFVSNVSDLGRLAERMGGGTILPDVVRGMVRGYMPFTGWQGQPQPVNYERIWEIAQDNTVWASISSAVDNILEGGWDLKPFDENTNQTDFESDADIIYKFFDRCYKWRNDTFDGFLANIVTTLMIYDDVYVLFMRNKHGYPVEAQVLDSDLIRIDYETDGAVRAYMQLMWAYFHREPESHQMGTWTQDAYGMRFPPERVIHAKHNRIGAQVYGFTPLQTINSVMRLKEYAERFNAAFFYNMGVRGIFIGKNVPKATWEKVKQEILANKMNPIPHDLAINSPEGEIEWTPTAKSEDMQHKILLEYARREIKTGLGASPIFTSEPEGSNRASSEVQDLSTIRHCRAIQERTLEPLFTTLLFKQKFDIHTVRFEFNKEDKRDRQWRVNISNGIREIATVNERRDILDMEPLEDEEQGKIIVGLLQPSSQGVGMTSLGLGEEGGGMQELEERLEETEGMSADGRETKSDADFLPLGDFGIETKSLISQLQPEVGQAFRTGLIQGAINFLDTYDFGFLTDLSKTRLKEIFIDTLEKRKGITYLVEQLSGLQGVDKDRAKGIARTEMSRALNEGSLEGAKQADIKLFKEWRAVTVSGRFDNRVADDSKQLHGQIKKLDESFSWTDAKGKAHAVMNPPNRPNDRCTLSYLLPHEVKWNGSKYVRANAKSRGRPGLSQKQINNLHKLKKEGKSITAIQKKTGHSFETLYKYLSE